MSVSLVKYSVTVFNILTEVFCHGQQVVPIEVFYNAILLEIVFGESTMFMSVRKK